MARDLQPKIIALPYALQKGALVLLPSTAPGAQKPKPAPQQGDDKALAPATAQHLRFQYNPESITRNRTGAWEPRKNQKVTAKDKQQQSNLRGGGLFSKAETIAMKLIFDATELLLRGEGDEGKLGVLPELGVLERIAIAEPPKDGAGGKKNPKAGDKLTALNPREVLLVLGSRAFPVIITSMNITEKRFAPDLTPLRAEVDLQMQILEATEAVGNQAITAAYDLLLASRAANARKALEPSVTMDVLAELLQQQMPSDKDIGG